MRVAIITESFPPDVNGVAHCVLRVAESGGLRTSLRELGVGYLAAGHEPVLIIPGPRDSDQQTAQGRVITLRAPRLPFTGGFRLLWRRRQVAGLLSQLRPDTLEVSDRATLRWTGRWARRHAVPAVMMSHESLVALFGLAALIRNLATPRPPGWRSSAGWPPRAPRGWSGARETWCLRWRRWPCTNGWAPITPRNGTSPESAPT